MFLKIEKVFKSHLHMIYNTKIKWYKNLLSLSTLWPQFNLLNRFYTTKSIQSFFHYVWEVRFPRGNLRFQKFKRGFNMLQNWLSTKYQPRTLINSIVAPSHQQNFFYKRTLSHPFTIFYENCHDTVILETITTSRNSCRV